MAKQNEMNKFTSPFWKTGNFQDSQSLWPWCKTYLLSGLAATNRHFFSFRTYPIDETEANLSCQQKGRDSNVYLGLLWIKYYFTFALSFTIHIRASTYQYLTVIKTFACRKGYSLFSVSICMISFMTNKSCQSKKVFSFVCLSLSSHWTNL